MLLSVLFKKRMFDQNKYPFMVSLLFFKLAFANGLSVLNSCAGESLVKTVTSVAKVNPAFVNAALAFLMFVQDDSENTTSNDTTRFSEPYIKEWLRSRGYDKGNKNISAAVIAKWLSFITGGLTSEKVKVYEFNLSRSREAARFKLLTNTQMSGVYLYGDGTHWTIDSSDNIEKKWRGDINISVLSKLWLFLFCWFFHYNTFVRFSNTALNNIFSLLFLTHIYKKKICKKCAWKRYY